jgi:hypothetical protein
MVWQGECSGNMHSCMKWKNETFETVPPMGESDEGE